MITAYKKYIFFKLKNLQKIFLPFIKLSKDNKYLFIMGCYNSGTTLLDYLLGCHEEISNLPTEGVALTNQLSNPEDYGWPRMWHKCIDKIKLDEDDMHVDVHRIKKQWSLFYEKTAKIFIEKSISNSARIKWLNKNFDDPYFIWIIRNGYCVSEGIRRRTKKSILLRKKFKSEGYPIDQCATQWVINNRIIEENLKGIVDVKIITYEQLTNNCDETLKYLFEWLPINDKKIPEYRNFKFHGIERPVKNLNTESISRLSVDDVSKINYVAGEYLKKWGYQIIKSGA